jgi:phenylacetate-CoA ligase
MLNRMGSAANSDWFGGAEAMGTWGALGDPATERGAMWTIDKNLPIERVFDILRDRHCSYVTAGPLLSHIGARDALRLGVDLRIEAILTQGNVVKPEDRAICRRVFGARMIEHYSTTEGGQLAHECPLGRLHLNVEGSLVEVLNDEGEPCGPGETGRVAITPIFQTAQPLIRYEIGDLATAGAPCACGRHSPTLLAVIGRTISVFHHPDGRAKTILLPPDTHDVLGSLYYQVAQTGPTTFEVRYVPADWEQAGDEQTVGVTLREMTFEDSQVRFVRLRDMPSGRSGKLIEYINEWSPAN